MMTSPILKRKGSPSKGWNNIHGASIKEDDENEDMEVSSEDQNSKLSYKNDSESESDEESSEDEDFVAWLNDPEVKKRIEEQNKKRNDAIKYIKDLKADTNTSEILQVVKDQIKLLGSEELFKRINRNLKEHKFEPFYVKEQYKLFKWREEFFHTKFGGYFNADKEVKTTWFTDGGDDSHGFDTVPFQITRNFDEIVALACVKKTKMEAQIYFENDEILSANANLKFSKEYFKAVPDVIFDMEIRDLKKQGLGFGEIAHMIMNLDQSGPPSLLECAMKTVLLYDIPLHDETLTQPCNGACCNVLAHKILHGLYSPTDETLPRNLTPTAMKLFEELRTKFGVSSIPIQRLRGVLVSWKNSYGFIKVDGSMKDQNIFVHLSDILKPRPFLTAGLRLEFQLESDRSRTGQKAVMARVLA